jgi:hypothetical protein
MRRPGILSLRVRLFRRRAAEPGEPDARGEEFGIVLSFITYDRSTDRKGDAMAEVTQDKPVYQQTTTELKVFFGVSKVVTIQPMPKPDKSTGA